MKIRRSNKILVCISNSREDRKNLLLDTVIAAGFARIRSDAAKLIKKSVAEIDLDGDFFIILANYSFNESQYVSNRLVRLALQGIPVIVATTKIPNAYLPFCEVITR